MRPRDGRLHALEARAMASGITIMVQKRPPERARLGLLRGLSHCDGISMQQQYPDGSRNELGNSWSSFFRSIFAALVRWLN
jgi:hypothetical protein